MKDSYGREIDYMRISITDRCNLRCQYCMPDGITSVSMHEILSFQEICQITAAAANLGIRHIKVTGGEPLVRLDCAALIKMLKNIEGIEKVTITTNGVLLEQYLDDLLDAGIDGINISLDTLDRQLFHKITGRDELPRVLSSIEKACQTAVPVKINAVSLRRFEKEIAWQEVLELACKYPLDVRFIEMMPIGYGKKFETIDHSELRKEIQQLYPTLHEDHSVHGFGPAVYYKIDGFQGSVGFISAIHGKFCHLCNRVRLTSQGYLKTCLCYEDGADLKSIIRSDADDIDACLKDTIRQAILKKPMAHCFEEPDKITEEKNMVMIGG